jgi:hypothetical protein
MPRHALRTGEQRISALQLLGGSLPDAEPHRHAKPADTPVAPSVDRRADEETLQTLAPVIPLAPRRAVHVGRCAPVAFPLDSSPDTTVVMQPVGFPPLPQVARHTALAPTARVPRPGWNVDLHAGRAIFIRGVPLVDDEDLAVVLPLVFHRRPVPHAPYITEELAAV